MRRQRLQAIFGFLILMSAPSLEAQEASQPEPATEPQESVVGLDEIQVIGSRVAGRSARDSVVPVDIIQGEDLQTYGIRDMDSLLSASVPVNSVRVDRRGISVAQRRR